MVIRKIVNKYVLILCVCLGSTVFASEQVHQYLKKYCYDCHGPKKQKAEIDYSKFKVDHTFLKHRKVWEEAVNQVAFHEMPPRKRKLQPSDKERKSFIQTVTRGIDNIDCSKIKDSGEVVVHRLNRYEYNNTIRDLTGIDLKPADKFPAAGGGGEGFDNNSEVMSMSPAMFEKYLEAARDISYHARFSYSRGIYFEKSPLKKHNDLQQKTTNDWELASYINNYRKENFKHLDDHEKKYDIYEPYMQKAVEYLAAKKKDPKLKTSPDDFAMELGKNRFLVDTLYSKLTRYKQHLHWKYYKLALEQVISIYEEKDPATITTERVKNAVKHYMKISEAARMTRHKLTNKSHVKLHHDMKNKKQLYLTVGPGRDGNNKDFVSWYNLKFVTKDKKDIWLKDLKPIHQEGIIKFKTNVHGKKPSMKGGKPEWIWGESAIGTQSPSQIAFNVPANASHFEGYICFDNSAGDNEIQYWVTDYKIPVYKDFQPYHPVYPTTGKKSGEVQRDAYALFDVMVKAFKVYDHHMRKLISPEELKPFYTDQHYYNARVYADLAKFEKQHNNKLTGEKADKKLVKRHEDLKNKVAKFEEERIYLFRESLKSFVRKVYRRPVGDQDIKPLMTLYHKLIEEDDNRQRAVQIIIQHLLVSPKFLYRQEDPQEGTGLVRIKPNELINRLSYFIWGSMPDERLIKLAENKEILKNEIILKEVERMLKDPRSNILAQQFAGQWLSFRDLKDNSNPDPKTYPEYAKLSDHMITEANLFFDHLFKNNLSILEILEAKWGFINEALAKHYGVSYIKGAEFRKVEFKDGRRGGILTMGSTLVATSYPQRPSPVLRGAWILEKILDSPTPTPPEDEPALDEVKKVADNATLREKLEVHRENVVCASCHNRIDPPGFTLSNFDGIGRWQDKDNGKQINALGEMQDGAKLNGPAELKKYLVKNKQKFIHTFCNKLLAFALGRSLSYYDYCTVKTMQLELEANQYRFHALVKAVVLSQPFQYRRGKAFKELAETGKK